MEAVLSGHNGAKNELTNFLGEAHFNDSIGLGDKTLGLSVSWGRSVVERKLSGQNGASDELTV